MCNKFELFLIGLMATSVLIVSAAFVPRIINGITVAIESHPYYALIGNALTMRCGGVIISQKYILTAAHCVNTDSFEDDFVHIKARSRNLQDGEWLRVKRQIQHPLYFGNHDHDLGLIELVDDIQFDNEARAIPLIHNDDEYDGHAMVQITGYGINDIIYKALPNNLQMIRIQLNTWDECKKVYGMLTKDTLCAGINSLQDSCSGDSGGPVTVQTLNGEEKLLGIVTFGHHECGIGAPGYFSRISYGLSWIHNITGDWKL